mgnify:CR=1 FL=1
MRPRIGVQTFICAGVPKELCAQLQVFVSARHHCGDRRGGTEGTKRRKGEREREREREVWFLVPEDSQSLCVSSSAGEEKKVP